MIIVQAEGDTRPALAHQAHANLLAAQKQVKAQTATRNALVKALRKSDPKAWTYAKLAAVVGCSASLIGTIVRG